MFYVPISTLLQWTTSYNFYKLPFSQARPIANKGPWEKATCLLPTHHASLVEKLSWVKIPMSYKKNEEVEGC
jgi:hypothetical protein